MPSRNSRHREAVAAEVNETSSSAATILATGESGYVAPTTAGKPGYALTAGERTSIAAAIWNATTSALTVAGSISKWLLDNIVTAGVGVYETSIVCQVDGQPVDGVEVGLSTDEASANVAHGPLTSDAFGRVTFHVDGTDDYYVWMQLSSYNFTNPRTLTWDAETEAYILSE